MAESVQERERPSPAGAMLNLAQAEAEGGVPGKVGNLIRVPEGRHTFVLPFANPERACPERSRGGGAPGTPLPTAIDNTRVKYLFGATNRLQITYTYPIVPQ